MSDREFSFDESARCDFCGADGAFDIYGDMFCADCLPSCEEDA